MPLPPHGGLRVESLDRSDRVDCRVIRSWIDPIPDDLASISVMIRGRPKAQTVPTVVLGR